MAISAAASATRFAKLSHSKLLFRYTCISTNSMYIWCDISIRIWTTYLLMRRNTTYVFFLLFFRSFKDSLQSNFYHWSYLKSYFSVYYVFNIKVTFLLFRKYIMCKCKIKVRIDFPLAYFVYFLWDECEEFVFDRVFWISNFVIMSNKTIEKHKWF